MVMIAGLFIFACECVHGGGGGGGECMALD